MFKLHAKPLVRMSPSPAAACEQPQQKDAQQQQQPPRDPLAAAAGFLGLKVFGGEALTGGEETAATETAAAPTALEIDGVLPPYSSTWERHLAYSYGLYDPRRLHKPLNPKDVEEQTALFKQALDAVDPKDACKYLQLEEFKCLREHQAHRDPEAASTKCVKWFQEWRQCKWDQEKLQKGYSYAEDRVADKHKPYIATPDYQYS